MFQENDHQTQAPPSPPAPPLAPGAPPLVFSPPPLVFARSRENDDPKVREILRRGDPLEIQAGFTAYEKVLTNELKSINSRIRAHEGLQYADTAKYNDLAIAITTNKAQKKLFKQKIALLPEVANITAITPGENENASARFIAKRAALSKENAEHAAAQALLVSKIENETREITALESERTIIKNKQRALSQSKARAVEEGIISQRRQVRIVPLAIASGRSLYEDKLCQMNEFFINIRPKAGCESFYKPAEILALQLKTFDEQDWGDDDEATLENKLRNALFLGRNDVKGLGGTPRENIRIILGYDIVDAYEQREREKQAEAERQRQALRAQRALETKEREEAGNLSGTTNVNPENSHAPQQSITAQSNTLNGNMRTPERTIMTRRLEQLQREMAEQAARLREEESARLAAQAAQLRAEEAARLTVQAAQLRAEQEAQNLREAQAQVRTLPQVVLTQPPKITVDTKKRKR